MDRELIGESSPCFSREIERAAAILWMGLRGEGEGLPSMLATSFAEAAGVAGRQKWGLVLSSSASVAFGSSCIGSSQFERTPTVG